MILCVQCHRLSATSKGTGRADAQHRWLDHLHLRSSYPTFPAGFPLGTCVSLEIEEAIYAVISTSGFVAYRL